MYGITFKSSKDPGMVAWTSIPVGQSGLHSEYVPCLKKQKCKTVSGDYQVVWAPWRLPHNPLTLNLNVQKAEASELHDSRALRPAWVTQSVPLSKIK